MQRIYPWILLSQNTNFGAGYKVSVFGFYQPIYLCYTYAMLSKKGTDMWVFRLQGSKDVAYAVGDHLDERLYESGFGHSLAITLFENPKDPLSWVVEGVTDAKPDMPYVETHIQNILKDNSLLGGDSHPYTLTSEKLPDTDWLAENRKQFPALEIAGFYIYGSHIEDPQPQDHIPLKIDASTAFGTGSHATTHGCLQALQDLKQDGFHPKTVLDVGTGTGILGMGAVRLFDCPVVATDIDQDAVEKAAYNVDLNTLQNHMAVVKADGVDDDHVAKAGPYDIVLANILAGPLMDMADTIKGSLASKGFMILSGILDHQAQDVIDTYVDGSLILKRKSTREEWATLVFQKV